MEDRVVPATLTPTLIRQAYGIDQIRFGAAGIVGNGAGQTIGIVEFNIDTSLVSDLQYFDQQLFGPGPDGAQLLDTFGSYTGPVQGSTMPWFEVVADPNYETTLSAGTPRQDLEAALDVEWAHAIAPMANILVVETRSNQSGTAYAAAQTQLGVSVVASSFGLFGSVNPTNYSQPNVAYIGITGDNGTSINSEHAGFTVNNYPAASPLVIAVGGTTLTLNADGSYGSETGWGFAGPNRFLTSGEATTVVSARGQWNAVSGGFSGTYDTTPGPNGTAISATWSTSVTSTDTLGKNDKGLEISTTWTPQHKSADNAEYEISVNGALVDTVFVNQKLAPNGTPGTLNSRTGTFQELCALSNLSVGDTITVTLLPRNADGTVVLDALGIGPDDASGGGLTNEPQPSYQNGLVIHNGSSVISSNGTRSYPDVAFDGDYINSPVEIYNQGAVQLVAGTSLGSPCWGALIAIADQGMASVGQPALSSEQALAGLYSLPSYDFHDETAGYNGYSAGPSYDLVTGLGSPIANQLIIDLDNTVASVSGPLIYEAPEGQGSNNIELIQNGSTLEILNNSTIVASAQRARTTSIEIIGAQSGLNTLTLNFGSLNSQVPAAPTGIPISFDGGLPGGTLVLGGGNFANEVDFANDAHSGKLYLDGTPIIYTGLAPIIDTATATNLTIADPMGNDVVTVGNDPNSPENGVPTSQISGGGFEKVDLANKADVIFDDYSLVGSDKVNVVDPLVNGATFTVQQIPNFTDGPATPSAFLGVPYTFAYTVQGTPAPTFSMLAGSKLPPGLTFSASGVLSGTPTAAGVFQGTVYLNNGVGVGATQNYTITVPKARPTITARAGGAVLLGSFATLTASAKLAFGYNETGVLAFVLYTPSNLIVDKETVSVSGNGIYTTPHGYLPRAIGTYEWVVAYSGDGNNQSVHTIKGQVNEIVFGLATAAVLSVEESSNKLLLDDASYSVRQDAGNNGLRPQSIESFFSAITGSASVTVGAHLTSAMLFDLTPLDTAPGAGTSFATVLTADTSSGNVANSDAHVSMVPFENVVSAVKRTPDVDSRITPRKSGNQKIAAVDDLFLRLDEAREATDVGAFDL
jgi:hypothetical protein